MLKVHSLKYAEEACFNSTLILKAFSSGLEIGSCNWTINGPRRNVAYLSSSMFRSVHAMGFDYRSLQGCDLVLFSDFSSLVNLSEVCYESNGSEGHEGEEHGDSISHDILASRDICDNEDDSFNCLFGSEECLEETDKISFICSSVMDSVRGGGSVLIPIGRLGIILLLLEQISQSLESSNLKVPIYMISSVAEETLTLTNSVPEWLCENRQQKLFSGEALFDHVKLIKEKKLHLFPQLHSPSLLRMWREPCIVISPHYSLRLGPVVHLLHRWHADSRCLLILEQGVDPELALLPFKTPAIMVLQCSFLSGIKLQKIQPLLTLLQPKLVLFPEDLKHQRVIEKASIPVLYYTENVTLRVPNMRKDFEACLGADLALQLKPKRLTQNNMAIARLTGQLLLRNGRYLLVCAEKPTNLSNRQLLHWGNVDPVRLGLALQEKGIGGAIQKGEDTIDGDIYSIQIKDPGEALVETSASKTVICTSDESMAMVIFEAIASVCDGI